MLKWQIDRIYFPLHWYLLVVGLKIEVMKEVYPNFGYKLTIIPYWTKLLFAHILILWQSDGVTWNSCGYVCCFSTYLAFDLVLGMKKKYILYCICLRSCCFGLETRVIIKISTHPCYSRHFDWFSWERSKKNLKWTTQKNWVFNIYFLNSMDCSWVSRFEWCVKHWCGSTYMVVKLKNRQKIYFLCF